MKKLLLCLLVSAFIFVHSGFAQEPDNNEKKEKKEKIKTGWNFGAVPAIAYDSDIGFRYGAIVNFFNYGDGTTYPAYKHSIYMEWSRTTKGSGVNEFTYDSKYLIPGIRTSFDVNYLTEQALDFYGFNGYEAYYNHDYELEDNPAYITRMYYRHKRKLMRITADFQGELGSKKLLWVAGLGFYGNNIGTVDIAKLNKDKDADELLPDTATLYDKYVEWGVIPENQKDGGNSVLLKLGAVYDTRDNEPNPMKGVWSEAFVLLSPKFLGSDFAYSQLSITHRQYFTVLPNVMNFVYRVGYQTKLSGELPFYMLPYIYYSNKPTCNGLGGNKNIRGILRNRVAGEGMAYANVELRWKFLRTMIGNQNFYIALSGFTDGAIVTKKYEYDTSKIPANYPIKYDDESLHLSYGMGLHFALNQNFIVAIDYGMAGKKDDGKSGLYINLNFLF